MFCLSFLLSGCNYKYMEDPGGERYFYLALQSPCLASVGLIAHI